MKKLTEIIEYRILNENYVKSSNYELEKYFDKSRYYLHIYSVFDTFRKDYTKFNRYLQDFVNTPLYFAKCMFKEKHFQEQFPQFCKENSMNVEIQILKKGKVVKTFNELKISNYAVKHFEMIKELKVYKKSLDEYIADIQDEYIFLTEEYGKNKELLFLLKHTKLAYILLKQFPENKKLHQLCENWLELLNKIAPILSATNSFGIDITKIFDFTPMSQSQFEFSNKLSSDMYNIYYKNGDRTFETHSKTKQD